MADLWYLSPSSQFGNVGVGDYGSEGQQMNLLMDLIVEHLDRCGVDFVRADREKGIEEKCAESDELGATWYFALHSNAGGQGKAWGPVAFHGGLAQELAEGMVAELLATGQKNNRAENVSNGIGFYEIDRPMAKACLLEVDFHDSVIGVEFITKRRAEAARAIAKAIVAADGKQWSEDYTQEDGASEWAKGFTQTAKQLGLFYGDDRGFRWQDPITREELAAVLIRFRELLR